ncbi:TIM barrel protein [Streptomyces sp. NPDC006872]|uniref:sugar phosphate isomerase/epimerase family protein n=1 Tax=Streptomyces sp. NPDC006872 TaxID=3155720 RepID=UPI00340A3150
MSGKAGLDVIEWGADAHAPPSDESALRRVRQITGEAGMTTCSYGSYWCAGRDDLDAFAAVAAAAVTLGAPRIRVWAGTEGSAHTPDRSRVIGALRDAAAIAAGRGLDVALEFHAGTLADTPSSTVRLLDEVGHDAVSTYWQPPLDEPDDAALAGLRTMSERVRAVHAFSWWPGVHRLALSEREALWRGALDLLSPVDVLLEFVPEDDPSLLEREARTLLSWLT